MMQSTNYRILTVGKTIGSADPILESAVMSVSGDGGDKKNTDTRATTAHSELPLFLFTPPSVSRSEYVKNPSELGISAVAQKALGADGLQRLLSFYSIGANWDGRGALSLNPDSVAAFSKFFQDTLLVPRGLAVFMSFGGNVVVNWEDGTGQVFEIEFFPDHLRYFLEAEGLEDSCSYVSAEYSRLFEKMVSVAA